MTVSSEPAGYWAEVRAEGPVYGTNVTTQYVLGAFQTISPVLALRWLRGEALRIADRLDPDPQCSAWARPWVRLDAVPTPDCPAELRVWATDPEEYQAVRTRLRAGEPYSTVVPDADCLYGLHVMPLPQGWA
ncbi:hypothetical protein ACPEIF_12695 [Streptomyces sp. NPDC012600]|uniref:hypothetical protein n=1 Tax=Streptomyces sp. NPDC012600 TaxID=3415005 RepID=UPI003C2E4DA1